MRVFFFALLLSGCFRVVYIPVDLDTVFEDPDTRECVTAHTTPPDAPPDAILVCSAREDRLYCIEYEDFRKRVR